MTHICLHYLGQAPKDFSLEKVDNCLDLFLVTLTKFWKIRKISRFRHNLREVDLGHVFALPIDKITNRSPITQLKRNLWKCCCCRYRLRQWGFIYSNSWHSGIFLFIWPPCLPYMYNTSLYRANFFGKICK